MFGRFHGLGLDEEISFKTNFPAVISGGSQEYSHMIQLPFHHGIKKVHIPFAAAPEHIVFSAQFHGSIQCRFYLCTCMAHDIEIGVRSEEHTSELQSRG